MLFILTGPGSGMVREALAQLVIDSDRNLRPLFSDPREPRLGYKTLTQAELAEAKKDGLWCANVDVRLALEFKRERPKALVIFVYPPSCNEFERHLREEYELTEEQVEVVVRNSVAEMLQANSCDLAVRDDDPKTCDRILRFIHAQRTGPRLVVREKDVEADLASVVADFMTHNISVA